MNIWSFPLERINYDIFYDMCNHHHKTSLQKQLHLLHLNTLDQQLWHFLPSLFSIQNDVVVVFYRAFFFFERQKILKVTRGRDRINKVVNRCFMFRQREPGFYIWHNVFRFRILELRGFSYAGMSFLKQ